ncbi:MAG: L,D-transpeptidase family protein [Alphaproteobacteria bacterium]|nr:L,D-transpeptidase family protein [Alphaproteobacteria bacterium]
MVLQGGAWEVYADRLGSEKGSFGAYSNLKQDSQEGYFEQALAQGRADGATFIDSAALQKFYAQRDNYPYWTGTPGVRGRADALRETLKASWKHGLNPHSYHLDSIDSLWGATGIQEQGTLELLLSDAFVRYVRDLSGIRVDPSKLRSGSEYWRKAPEASEVLEMLSGRQRIQDILRAVEPKGATYKAMQAELVRLSTAPEEPYAAILPIDFDGALMRPGWRHKSVPALRVRLGVQPQTQDEKLYDDRLAAAVMRFQRDNGLEPDAIIGSTTLQMLNQTNQKRIMQLIANMERLRWVPEDKPDRFVVVNIPSATLWAIDKGRVRFEMPVIVGSPARPTSSFITQIEGVRFNPDWTVPSTIKRFDILPKIQAEPDYLQNKGIEIIKGYGEAARTLDPASINWATISAAELNSLRMVQIPGEHNPLGRIRILMPNKYNIYLHDTNHPEYFEKAARAVSSGCIRLYNPEKMASFIMEGRSGWRGEDMRAVLETLNTTDIEIQNYIPVYVLYYTAWLDENGRVIYGPDIYKQDQKLLKMLSNLDALYIPVDNNHQKAQDLRPASLVSAR